MSSSYTLYSGEVSSGLVLESEDSLLLSGGTAVNTIVKNGALKLYTSDSLASNTVMNGGTLFASGGRIENTLLNDGTMFDAFYDVDITGTTVNSGCSATFYTSEVDGTVVNSGGKVKVFGGAINNTLVTRGGTLSITNEGVTASKTTVSGASAIAENKAVFTSTTIDSGYLTLSGGTAVDTTLTDYAAMIVMSDGLASNTVVDCGAGIKASYGTIEGVTINSGGWLSAGSQVSATGIVVNSSGSVTNYALDMKNVTVNSGGYVNLLGGHITSAFINAGGTLYAANYGAAANNMVISGDGWNTQAKIANGAWVSSTTVESGYLHLSSGCVANDTDLNDSGVLKVSSGAVAYNTIINSGASMGIEGGSADIVTVNFGGRFSAEYAYGMGSASSANAMHVRENGGFVYIGSGSSGTSRYDYDEGRWVYDYTYYPFPVEFSSNTFSGLVYSDYKQGTVHSGTTATDISTVNGGLIVYSGGSVGGYTIKPVTWTSSYTAWQYTSHVDEETGRMVYESSSFVSNVEVTTIGGLNVLSGGKVTGLVAESLDDIETYSTYLDFEIAPGTEISGTIDGSAFETYNGIMSSATLKNTTLTYMDGASVSDVNQYNGSASVLSGASARNMNFSGTNVRISSGGIVNGLNTFVVPYSYIDYGWGPEAEETLVETSSGANVSILAGATVTGLNFDAVSYLTMEVSPGTIVDGTSAGAEFKQSGGYFGDTVLETTYVQVKSSYRTADARGNVVYVNGGTVANTIVNNGAVVYAEDYSTVLNMTENGGAVITGDQDRPTVTYSFASNTFTNGHLEGLVTVHENTIAQNNFMYGGDLTVYRGGVVNNFYTVAGDMSKGVGMNNAEFLDGAIVSNFDMVRYSEGQHHPGSVGMAAGVKMNHVRLTDFDGISMEITSSTVITDGAVDNIPFSVENGVLSGFVGDADGWYSDSFRVWSGAQMIDCYFNGYGEVNVESGGFARNLTMANNYLMIESGGVAENVTVGLPPTMVEEDGYSYMDYNSAVATIYDGAVLSDFTVADYSHLEVMGGGVITGEMNFEEGAYATVSRGGTVMFDLTDPGALYSARLNNLHAVEHSGTPTYAITVSADKQAKGDYLLANLAYFGEGNYRQFYLYGDNGEDYGYFETWYTSVRQEDGTYLPEFMCYIAGNAPSGFMYDMKAERIDLGEGVYDFDLYFSVVESPVDPTPWLAAPTVTADTRAFTNIDVILTVDGSEDMVTKEYSADGETWMVCGDTFYALDNGTYFFRGSNADGVMSDTTEFRVSNIDKVAPTDPGSLSVSVDESTVNFSWSDVTDDFSGVSKFALTFWNDDGDSYTVRTPWCSYTLTDATNGTWHWTVEASDNAGNTSAIMSGNDFTVSGGVIPRIDLPDFLVGDFDGGETDRMATLNSDNIVTIYVNGASWGNGLALDPGWDLAGVGDFNADGRDDFLRINAEGYVVGEMTQADGTFAAQVLNFKNAGWSILGTGDFNGNGSDDVLIANPTGASDTVGLLGYWESGVTWTLINGYSAEWECIATGDFNNDGKCDMLWRNEFVGDGGGTYNAYCTWIVEDPVDWRMVSVANPAEWNFLCAGDFNGDGANDIAMINDVGVVGIWGVEDGWLSSWSILSAVDTSEWKLVGVGDFNGDGTDDIGWCSNISGLAGYWQIEDKTLAGWQNLASLA